MEKKDIYDWQNFILIKLSIVNKAFTSKNARALQRKKNYKMFTRNNHENDR
jgi:hypothetical protein